MTRVEDGNPSENDLEVIKRFEKEQADIRYKKQRKELFEQFDEFRQFSKYFPDRDHPMLVSRTHPILDKDIFGKKIWDEYVLLHNLKPQNETGIETAT